MRIYIASSFRNLAAVHLLRDALRARGHEVLDWSELAPPLPPDMPAAERRARLDSDARGEIFRFCARACRGACGKADLVIYLGPAGQDAAAEVGMAWAANTPVLGLAGALESPGLILSRCVQWHDSVGDLLAAVDEREANQSQLRERALNVEVVPHPEEVHALAKEKGWYDGIDTVNLSLLPPDFIPARLALVHSEISEAVEAYRKDGIPNNLVIEKGMGEGGFAEELADAVLRIFDLAGLLHIPIAHCIQEKHNYNRHRPYRHGGKVV